MVCLHFPSIYSKPIGIWFWDEKLGSPNAYYLSDSFSKYMEVAYLFKSLNKKQWDKWLTRLSERTPVDFNFEVVDIYVEPKQFLDNLIEVGTWAAP